MSQNPFETPQASPYAAPPPIGITGTGSFDIGQAVSEGWAATTSNVGVAIGGFVVSMFLMMLGYLTIVGIFLVIPVVGYGMIRLFLNLRDGHAEFGDLFDGFRSYGSALGSMLLFGLIMIVIQSPGIVLGFVGGFTETPSLAALGQVYNLVVAVLVLFRLYFAPFFIVDRQMGAVDAVKAAWEATADQKLATFGLAFVSGLVGMSGVIALGIGLLFTIPLSYTIWAAAYRQMVGS